MNEYLFRFLEVPRQLPRMLPVAVRVQGYDEIYGDFQPDQAAVQSSRCLDCGNPYCEHACPVHNDIPGWLKLVRDGHLLEAAERMHDTNPLPEMCGRVCPQDRLCEGACTLEQGDFGAVTIGSVERWVVDEAFRQGWRPDLSAVKPTGRRVAIVGAGPAGLACADRLARAGIEAHVFDAHEQIGGLLTFGIPPFKLDKQAILTRRAVLEGMGVRFRLNTRVGIDLDFSELLDDYDAVFTGVGAALELDGALPGLQLPGVHTAMPFLVGNMRRLFDGAPPDPRFDVAGRRVVVLGGGDTGMDCVRTAIRLGASEVTCVYRRDEADMPGSRREVANARDEGVRFVFRRQPLRVLGGDRVEGVELVETELLPGGGRRVRPHYKAGSEHVLAADAVLVAFGFHAEPPSWSAALGIGHDGVGRTVVGGDGRLPFQTAHPRVFAGGDMVRGADLVVRAVHDGREAAGSIVRSLGLAAGARVGHGPERSVACEEAAAGAA